jgi:N-acetylmuramic acid 6-phosphate etherase
MNKVEEFLAVANQFKLGHLTTESPHPMTERLSQLAQTDLSKAIQVLHQVDLSALNTLREKSSEIFKLSQEIHRTLEKKNKIFMVGCGATGRLSLVLETLSLQMNHYPGQIISFMAGGDFALVRSVESFEDHTAYGARQLLDLGFKDGDFLLAITEGGETPFVIGACQKAAQVSSESPWFLYCNPDQALMGLERCREVIENPHIVKLNLTCGPMALTGSTRMQAASVQMFATGLALLYPWDHSRALAEKIDRFIEFYANVDFSGMPYLIEREASDHAQTIATTYISEESLAISVLTDTTERAPTFSQPGFENTLLDCKPTSPIYLSVTGTHSASLAWHKLLGRSPRCLDWPELKGKVNEEIFMGFDISLKAHERRRGASVTITPLQEGLCFARENYQTLIPVFSSDPLFLHMSLKMMLNMHSTLMMGRRGFYLDNLMTWVRPSNYKLIDRATRYLITLAARRGREISYERGARLVIEMMEREPQSPVVIKVLQHEGIEL